jgi:arabinogalactan oligomer / maltooligosaccharide transport system permease protein
MTSGSGKSSSSSFSWQSIVGWGLGAALLVFTIITILDLNRRVLIRGFAILYPENAGRNVLLGLLGAVGLIFVTSYIGKLWGERTRQGRKINYWAIMTDQLTHVFFWGFIIFVVSASFDPRNTLTDASLGDVGPLIVRAKVLPSLEGKDFSNYEALFKGVVIAPWQFLGLGVFVLGILGIAALWFMVQANAGKTNASISQNRTRAYWAIALGLLVFFGTLGPSQFTGQGSLEAKFLLWLRNTFIISTITGVLTVLLTTTVGYAMARLRFPGRFQMLLFFIFVQMFPVFLAAVAIYDLMYRLGLLGSFAGLILAYSGGSIAYGTWIYKGYVESLPPSLEEAALVDGCTRWTAFTRVVLPLSGPMLVFIFLQQFIGTYAEFFLANILLAAGVDNWNIGLGLRSFAQQFTAEYGKFSAAAVLGALPIVALFYGFQQFFVSGALSGGVKE